MDVNGASRVSVGGNVGGVADFDEVLRASTLEIVVAVIVSLTFGIVLMFLPSRTRTSPVGVEVAVAIDILLASGLLYSLLAHGEQRVTVLDGRVTVSQRGECHAVQFLLKDVVDAYLANWQYSSGYVSIQPADLKRNESRVQPTMNWLFATLLGVVRYSSMRNGVVVHLVGRSRPYLILSARPKQLLSALHVGLQ